ncbi:hypothetical protein C5O00_04400 [Pukyongia salina]|uniref:LysM domain-containing protein n=1 Tax=Pukyongia salina TaxID=2094025 RepID=A0A2S0HV65_9FLAO|nr:hypothetical protein [Pukyongia salina]AVI50444.1 hypothetical protein C5O00_04400 [Pukyongia salina]
MSLNKLKLIAYKNNKYSGKGQSSCTVEINPASYSHSHQVNYNNTTSEGAPGTPLKFKGIPPETVSFEIYFDASGAIADSKTPLKVQIDRFKKVCFDYNGDIHEPNYLIISWGSLVFKCKLTSLDINYTLFKPNGSPIRAKASVKFEEASDVNTIAKEANKKSPDLTHKVVTREGDTLPLICYDIYGDSSYYLEVAKYNNIANFRNLIPGTTLYVPPIK